MALKQSKQVVAGVATPTAYEAHCPVYITGEYVTVAGDAINDIVEMGAIPAELVPVDLIVDNGALGASATLDAGILSGEYGATTGTVRTMGNEFFAAAAAATSGVIRRNKNVNAVASNEADIGWGIKFLGANPAAGQTIRATLVCRPVITGIA